MDESSRVLKMKIIAESRLTALVSASSITNL